MKESEKYNPEDIIKLGENVKALKDSICKINFFLSDSLGKNHEMTRKSYNLWNEISILNANLEYTFFDDIKDKLVKPINCFRPHGEAITVIENKKKAFKIWSNNWYHNECEDFELFYKWFTTKNIDRQLDLLCWRQVTKKGIRGLREPECSEFDWPLKDHTTTWRSKEGKKYIICHPYWWYPEDWEQFEGHFNEISKTQDFEPKLKELIDWCNDRNLNVVFYKSSESWYCPGNSIMFEISEKD